MSRNLLCALVVIFVSAFGIAALAQSSATVAPPVHVHHELVDDVSSYGCGVQRWAVKTGTDLDADKVNLSTTTWTSPGRLVKLPALSNLPADNRVAPTEDTVYRMTVTLIAFKEEADSDIHLQLVGGSGVHMIAEVPAGYCTQANSPFDSRIISARSTFQSLYGTVSGSWSYVNKPIALTGVGFFDYRHGQTGVASNGIELHPILSVRVP